MHSCILIYFHSFLPVWRIEYRFDKASSVTLSSEVFNDIFSYTLESKHRVATLISSEICVVFVQSPSCMAVMFE